MSWKEVLKDNTELKRQNILHADNLFRQKGKQWAAQFGGQSNAKYQGLSMLVDKLEHSKIFNDDKRFFEIFDRITFLLA